nr:mutant XCL-OB7 protein [synthetic construct]
MAYTVEGVGSEVLEKSIAVSLTTQRLPIKNIKTYTIKEGSVKAVIFITRRGFKIAADPQAAWVKKAVQKIDRKNISQAKPTGAGPGPGTAKSKKFPSYTATYQFGGAAIEFFEGMVHDSIKGGSSKYGDTSTNNVRGDLQVLAKKAERALPGGAIQPSTARHKQKIVAPAKQGGGNCKYGESPVTNVRGDLQVLAQKAARTLPGGAIHPNEARHKQKIVAPVKQGGDCKYGESRTTNVRGDLQVLAQKAATTLPGGGNCKYAGGSLTNVRGDLQVLDQKAARPLPGGAVHPSAARHKQKIVAPVKQGGVVASDYDLDFEALKPHFKSLGQTITPADKSGGAKFVAAWTLKAAAHHHHHH